VVILAWIFKEKWFWIIILSIVTVVVLPFIIILAILNLGDPVLRVVAIVLLLVCWGVAGAYKDWTKSKREEEERMKKRETI
jgi:hypothetical protein